MSQSAAGDGENAHKRVNEVRLTWPAINGIVEVSSDEISWHCVQKHNLTISILIMMKIAGKPKSQAVTCEQAEGDEKRRALVGDNWLDVL